MPLGGDSERKPNADMEEAARKYREALAGGDKVKHTVAEGETLSDLSLKYYGSAGKDYYMVIYNANKATIGDNPNVIRIGDELTIPDLPANLKD